MDRAQLDTDSQGQLLLPCNDLVEEMNYFVQLGFRLIHIFPDDSPEVAVMEGYGLQLRLDINASVPPGSIVLLTDNPEQFPTAASFLTSPSGTTLSIQPKTYQVAYPPTQHKFEVRQLMDQEPWVIGRAGMLYRDLIPDRLGGGIMASHIRIPIGGPVPDMVHYHTIGFQLIYCYHGWVKLVYEDQGEPFILRAGDCVTQPPEIRHRVLEASDNLEVIEIGVPAEHMTSIDHHMELPTNEYRPDREFQGQKFCHHIASEAEWKPWKITGFEYRDTGINASSKGVASVEVARPKDQSTTPPSTRHDADILFTFMLSGRMELKADGHPEQQLKQGDAFVVPPHLSYQILNFSSDLELLEVKLPGTH